MALWFSQKNGLLVRHTERIRNAGAMFGYLAAILQGIAYIWYGWTLYDGQTMTNPVAWYLWFAETAIGLAIYTDRTKDGSKWLSEAVAMFGIALTVVYLTMETFSGNARVIWATVELTDIVPTGFAIMAFILWLRTRKTWGPSTALWFFQIAIISAAVPLIRATYADPSVEPFGPWALWTVSFTLQAICAWWRWDGTEPLLNPLNYAITHGFVAWIIWQHAAS